MDQNAKGRDSKPQDKKSPKNPKNPINNSNDTNTSNNSRKVNLRTLRYFFKIAKKYMALTLGAILLTPVVIFVRSAFIPLVLANMIDIVTKGIPDDQIIPVLLPQGLLLIGAFVVSSILLGELRLFCTWRMEIRAMYDIATMCFDTVSAQSMQFHSDRFSGSLVSQTNKFIGAFERFFDTFTWSLLPLISSFTFIFIILSPKVPVFAIALAVFIAIYTLVSATTFKKIAHLNTAEATAFNKTTGQLADSISNITSVKSYAREAHERKRYAGFVRSWYRAADKSMKAVIIRDIGFSCINLSIIILIVFFLMFGPSKFGLATSTLVLIVTYSQQVLSNLWDINSIFKNFNRIFGDAYDMTLILDSVDEVVDMPNAKTLPPSKGSINFDHVTFAHHDSKEAIFEDFNLDIQPGERVGLVGASGSGKSTLTRLLLRFADIDSGQISIDQHNIQQVTQKSLRENIAYVPQETALFHRTIFENIAYGKPDATREEIIRAAKLANADDFIRTLPDGYDTLVGERGTKLSGGQRQRVAIARAILKNAPILVLDEATSALDTESESLIQDALLKLMKDRTSIVIAHRLSTVANLDRIIVLKDGKIIEQGTHTQLIAKNGTYKNLWSRQSTAQSQ